MISIYLLAAIIPMIFTSTTKEGVFRLLAFAWAPALFGSILAIVPWIGGLCALVLGLYSIYVFVVGISVVTGVQNPLGFTIVTVILAIVIGIVLGAIQGIFIPTSHQIPEVTFEGSEGGVFQLDQQKMRDLQQQLEKFAPTPP